jgi:hypothetical protein
MKKFNMGGLKPVSTPMSMSTVLHPNENGETIDQREYRSMISSLLYLRATWLDIQFVVCLYAHVQASPRSSHRQVVQRIFRYLKYTLEFGIWYSLLHHLILLAFPMLILRVVELIERAILVHVTFLDLLSFVGLLINKLLLHNPSQRLSM